jgi:hypothetical protein
MLLPSDMETRGGLRGEKAPLYVQRCAVYKKIEGVQEEDYGVLPETVGYWTD